jgi:aminoglycoside phosphotransferase (APT) family kinase protein
MTIPTSPEQREIKRSSRDPEMLRAALERWLAGRLDHGASPAVLDLEATSTNGLSSDTILFTAGWTHEGADRRERLVARIAPDPGDVPVFPHYDLRRQFEVMRLVAERTSVPVPRVWWYEPSADVIGAPFFVMERVDGIVPPDVMPYNFGDNWLFDASPVEQRRLQSASVDVLVALHRLDATDPDLGFLELAEDGDTHLHRHFAHTRAWYEFATSDAGRSPLVESGFDWLEAHWPAHEGEPVVCWGDARIGNVIYRDFEPVAVLDWEMVALGPRELDVAWMLFAHRVFEDLAHGFDLPGMPSFLDTDDVVTAYRRGSGVELRDLDFHLVYAAVQWGIVFLRTGWRRVHFGEIEPPGAPDDLLHHRALLARMIDA